MSRSNGFISAIAVIAMASACSFEMPSPPEDPAAVTGKMIVSGALNAKYETLPIKVRCIPAALVPCSVSIVARPSSVVSAYIYFPDGPAVRSYAETDSDARATMQASTEWGVPLQTWFASAYPGSTRRGTYTLKVTEVSAPVQGIDGAEYLIHATFDATLVGAGTATGTVTLHVTF
jgi:hypothetical protein